jgi:hypothetical protein
LGRSSRQKEKAQCDAHKGKAGRHVATRIHRKPPVLGSRDVQKTPEEKKGCKGVRRKYVM